MTVRILLILTFGTAFLSAHEAHGDRTYEIEAAGTTAPGDPVIELDIRDRETGDLLAARFSLEIDGKRWTPDFLNEHGIHFTSIHARKKQWETILYSRGTGPVRFGIPEDSSKVVIHVARGLQYRTQSIGVEPGEGTTSKSIALQKFVDLSKVGWWAADEHLHYERRDPKHDADWLAMLDADGLNHGFFMVLKGGNFDDTWAQQHAYGEAGLGRKGNQLLVTGEEFRGTMQGHNNLLGLSEVLTPISVGGMGKPPHPFNAPSTHDVLVRTRELGGIGGPAHGGTFGRASTAILDALTGASGFFELANTHLFRTEVWYRVMNCGAILPPVAGTDLPNFPYRDPWQPFFGEVRTFVRTDRPDDFAAWKQALRAGRVFVSSGPLLEKFTVSEAGLGESVDLPAGGGEITIEAELVSPRPIDSFEIVRNGEAMKLPLGKSTKNGIHRWIIHRKIAVTESCWLAARGFGQRKERLFAEGQHLQKTMMHSAAIPVIVGGQPIRVEADVEAALKELGEFRERYRVDGKFPDDATRDQMLKLFDQAIAKLKK